MQVALIIALVLLALTVFAFTTLAPLLAVPLALAAIAALFAPRYLARRQRFTRTQEFRRDVPSTEEASASGAFLPSDEDRRAAAPAESDDPSTGDARTKT